VQPAALGWLLPAYPDRTRRAPASPGEPDWIAGEDRFASRQAGFNVGRPCRRRAFPEKCPAAKYRLELPVNTFFGGICPLDKCDPPEAEAMILPPIGVLGFVRWPRRLFAYFAPHICNGSRLASCQRTCTGRRSSIPSATGVGAAGEQPERLRSDAFLIQRVFSGPGNAISGTALARRDTDRPDVGCPPPTVPSDEVLSTAPICCAPCLNPSRPGSGPRSSFATSEGMKEGGKRLRSCDVM